MRQARVRTPTVLQMEAVECGAAALAMILAWHGRYVTLEELRLACGVSRDGSKANNILKAARSYGLNAKGYRKEPAELRGLPLPFIVHWNFNHFVVVDRFRRGRVYLNDPAFGPTTLSDADFDRGFTGVVLTFEKDATFQVGGDKPSLIAPLRRRLSGSGRGVAYVVGAGVALVVPGLAAPSFSKVYLDDVVVKGLTEWVPSLLLIMAATAALIFALVFLQQRYLLRLENRLSLDMSGRFFWHVLRLPVEFFTQRYAGEIGNRVAINDKVAKLLAGDLASTVVNLLLIAAYAVLLVQYDAVLSAITIATAWLNLAVLRYASRVPAMLNQRLAQDRGKLMGTAMGGLQTIETLKATGSESDVFMRWSGYQAKVLNGTRQLQRTMTLVSALPPFLLAVNTALMLGIGGLRVIDGRLTIGMLLAFQALMFAFLAPVNRMVQLGSVLHEIKGDVTRLDDVLRARPDVGAEAPESVVVAEPKLAGRLELRRVTFGYSRLDPPLLHDFSLTINPGSRVALIGGSGSGKTTVAKLVSGLYAPWSGELLFDGLVRPSVPRSVMNASLAVVDQDICLFEDTVRENLTLWDPTVPEATLIDAARDACIHDDIASRPGGYASHVEEGGRNFSGGQRQRLEIARALVGGPRILVLDEAMSALDTTTEQQIDDNLRKRGCACLIIAHRLSTIRDCDEIVVLDKGRVVQRGTHEELIAASGPYAALIASE